MNVRPLNSFRIVARADLTPGQVEAMQQLLAHHFDGVTPAQFAHDLAEKNWVILIRRAGQLVGFSTLLVYETAFAGTPVSVVYSGDTIVAREAWGSSALARGWITAVNQLRVRYPRGKYYWLLLTSGFRTYRFLPVFWREFYPRVAAVTPRHLQQLRDHLAAERFGDRYNAVTGIVRFLQPQQLQGVLQQVPVERTGDPHVAFFSGAQPRSRAGR